MTASRLSVTCTLYYQYATESLVVDSKGRRIEPVEMKFLVDSVQNTMKQFGR